MRNGLGKLLPPEAVLPHSPIPPFPHSPFPHPRASSTAIPIAWYPLSTYNVVPVMPLARGEQRNAVAVPTSSAVR